MVNTVDGKLRMGQRAQPGASATSALLSQCFTLTLLICTVLANPGAGFPHATCRLPCDHAEIRSLQLQPGAAKLALISLYG